LEEIMVKASTILIGLAGFGGLLFLASRAKAAPSLPTTGSVSISSIPTGAEVYIDGSDHGVVTPVSITSLPPGPHNYKLTLAGYNDYTDTFTIKAGETTTITAVLIPIHTYNEAELISCQWPSNMTVGQANQIVITVNQGSATENYIIVFSGDFVGESTPFTVNTGTGQQQFTVGDLIFSTGGTKNVTASLVKA
jgi:hypothetical protein